MGNRLTQPAAGSRLAKLMDYLESDPENLTLLADAAQTALAQNRPDVAWNLLGSRASASELPDHLVNLAGLSAMQLGEYGDSIRLMEPLHNTHPDDPDLRFNLAWSRAMEKDFSGAAELLDENTVAALPQAAMLDIQLLHECGDFEGAALRARNHMSTHPEHRGLQAAISVLAMDVEDPEWARETALRAGDHPDAFTTLGTLALGDHQTDAAMEYFTEAVKRNEDTPRAWIGMGLTELEAGRPLDAARHIDRGAELFKTHLGSWIAAGWAYLTADDLETSRARFEHAMALDKTFAETHGALAVLDILDNRLDSARDSVAIAVRLDRECFSAALANAMLLSGDGDAETAKRIFDRALNTPVNARGQTIAQALARLNA